MKKVAVFGASGFLGSQVSAELTKRGYEPIPVGRSQAASSPVWFNVQVGNFEGDIETLLDISGAVWVQGSNSSDSYADLDSSVARQLFDANYFYVALSMSKLAGLELTRESLNFVVVTSVWASASKRGKASYSASKAAARSLVTSASLDLRDRAISVVGIELGVVDSPMTREHLSQDALERVSSRCLGKELIAPSDLGAFVDFLLSASGRPLTGQNVVFDNGLTVGIEI